MKLEFKSIFVNQPREGRVLLFYDAPEISDTCGVEVLLPTDPAEPVEVRLPQGCLTDDDQKWLREDALRRVGELLAR